MTLKRSITLAALGAGAFGWATVIRADPPGTPAEPPPPPAPVVRIYDVHDLLEAAQENRISEDPRAQKFAAALIDDSPSTNSLIGSPPSSPFDQREALQRDMLQELSEAIESAVAPDSWRDKGGPEGAIRGLHGLLIVTQSPANQKLVEDFLDQTSEHLNETVRVEVDWVWESRENLEKLFAKSPPAEQASSAVREVDPVRLASLPAETRHVHAEVSWRNGRTMFIVSGREKSLVTNTNPVVSTASAAFAPTVGVVAGGAAMQVKAMANADAKYAVLTLAGGFAELGPTRQASAAGVVGSALEISSAATQPSEETQTTIAVPARVTPHDGPSTRPTSGSVQSPFETASANLQELRTTVRVPLGRPVVVAGATWDPTAKGQHSELLVIVTVHAK